MFEASNPLCRRCRNRRQELSHAQTPPPPWISRPRFARSRGPRRREPLPRPGGERDLEGREGACRRHRRRDRHVSGTDCGGVRGVRAAWRPSVHPLRRQRVHLREPARPIGPVVGQRRVGLHRLPFQQLASGDVDLAHARRSAVRDATGDAPPDDGGAACGERGAAVPAAAPHDGRDVAERRRRRVLRACTRCTSSRWPGPPSARTCSARCSRCSRSGLRPLRARGRRRGATPPVLLLFALGIMAKPMLVTLPFVLLLLDYWPLGRWRGANCRIARASRPSRANLRAREAAVARHRRGVIGAHGAGTDPGRRGAFAGGAVVVDARDERHRELRALCIQAARPTAAGVLLPTAQGAAGAGGARRRAADRRGHVVVSADSPHAALCDRRLAVVPRHAACR